MQEARAPWPGLPREVIKGSRSHKQSSRAPLSLDKGLALQSEGPRGASNELRVARCHDNPCAHWAWRATGSGTAQVLPRPVGHTVTPRGWRDHLHPADTGPHQSQSALKQTQGQWDCPWARGLLAFWVFSITEYSRVSTFIFVNRTNYFYSEMQLQVHKTELQQVDHNALVSFGWCFRLHAYLDGHSTARAGWTLPRPRASPARWPSPAVLTAGGLTPALASCVVAQGCCYAHSPGALRRQLGPAVLPDSTARSRSLCTGYLLLTRLTVLGVQQTPRAP